MELITTPQAAKLERPLRLENLADRLHKEAEKHQDFPNIRFGGMRMRLDGTMMVPLAETAWLTRHALSQVCARLEVPGGGTLPAGYLTRCPEHLTATNLNYWLGRQEQGERRVLVRMKKLPGRKLPVVRAVLSDRYATVDHLPLVQALSELAPLHDLDVQGWSLDDESFTLRLVNRADHPASLKDPLRVGVAISNSEVGLGQISIQALITRLVCSNGLVVKVADLGGVHRRHVGRTGERLDETVRAALPRVLEEADEACRRFVKLRDTPVPEVMADYLKKTARDAELPETVLPKVERALEGETLYDVVNAFTQVAQGYSIAERVRIETAMSRLLTDKHHWN